MIRNSSNFITATNYGFEGDREGIRPVGRRGPWLPLNASQTAIPNDFILTKTHCQGYCNGPTCVIERNQSVLDFSMGCLSGFKVVVAPNRTNGKRERTRYSHLLVKRAIHLFRHPLDNIVARFHHAYNQEAKHPDFVRQYPRNQTGFHRWCAWNDQSISQLKESQSSSVIDPLTRNITSVLPCQSDFFRYIQWHNLAFATTKQWSIPTLMLRYDEYEDDFEGTRARLLEWLHLPLVPDSKNNFQPGKVYRHYYSLAHRKAIYAFLQEMASPETWEMIRDYDFMLDSDL
jgi:hypothetical protein